MSRREISFVGVKFKDHRTSHEIMTQIHDLRHHGKAGPHAYAQLFVGPTGVGKSALLQAYVAKFPPTKRGLQTIRPVLYVEAPEKCTTKGLAEQFLRELNDPAPTSGTEAAMVARVIQHLMDQEVELSIVDEGQQLTSIDGFVAGNFFKQLLNKGKRPILIAGLPSTLFMRALNRQFKDRLKPVISLEAIDWRKADGRKALRVLLQAIEGMMMFDLKDFHLADHAFAARLAYASRGLLRRVINLITEAEAVGRMRKREKLTVADFAEAWRNYNPEEDRRDQSVHERHSQPVGSRHIRGG